jgi:uncharacterized HAD superfamily protein
MAKDHGNEIIVARNKTFRMVVINTKADRKTVGMPQHCK